VIQPIAQAALQDAEWEFLVEIAVLHQVRIRAAPTKTGDPSHRAERQIAPLDQRPLQSAMAWHDR